MNKSTVLVVGVMVLSCLGAYWIGSGIGNSDRANTETDPIQLIAGLAVDRSLLNIGEVWEESDFDYELPIQNRTSVDVTILDFSVSCGCLKVEPRSLAISPGMTEVVRIKLDLTARSHGEIGLARRSLGIEITPILKSGWPRGSGWKLQGVIKSRITLDMLSLHFGETIVDGQPPIPRKVIATVHVPTMGLEAIVGTKSVDVQVSRRTQDPDQFEVVVTPQPSLAPGPFESRVTLNLRTPEGGTLPGVILPIAGQVQQEVRPLPARLLLGPKSIGETAETYVVLQALAGAKVAIERIETDSPDIHVEAAPVRGSPAGRTFRVKQRVTKLGDQVSSIRFIIHKPGKSPITAAVEVHYLGQSRDQASATKTQGEMP
jgi:hypothetical protein